MTTTTLLVDSKTAMSRMGDLGRLQQYVLDSRQRIAFNKKVAAARNWHALRPLTVGHKPQSRQLDSGERRCRRRPPLPHVKRSLMESAFSGLAGRAH